LNASSWHPPPAIRESRVVVQARRKPSLGLCARYVLAGPAPVDWTLAVVVVAVVAMWLPLAPTCDAASSPEHHSQVGIVGFLKRRCCADWVREGAVRTWEKERCRSLKVAKPGRPAVGESARSGGRAWCGEDSCEDERALRVVRGECAAGTGLKGNEVVGGSAGAAPAMGPDSLPQEQLDTGNQPPVRH
jgi:hypothetical protein